MATQSTPFGYLTWLQLRQQLAARLNDPSNTSWTDAENKLYLIEALRVWNVLTQYWPQDYTFTLTPPLSSSWSFLNNLSTGASPRAQTLTETDLYNILCYHLMEPLPTAGVWAGTSQFTITDLQTAAQQIRDEILQATAANMQVLPGVALTPGTNRTFLPDTTLDVRRIRYTGTVSEISTTLVKGDSNSFLRFSPSYRQTFTTPTRYDILGSPPLAYTVDFAPTEPNTSEILAIEAGNTLSPTSPQPLQIPNDWLFVLKWGVLWILLSKEAESTDHQRANYCRKRYEEGLRIVQSMPWLLNGFLNNVACDIVPVISKDRNSVDWESNPSTWPTIVIGGTDLIAPAPIPTDPTSPLAISLILVGNAPIPSADGDFVQAPRDILDAILDYAQNLAALKQAGDESFETIPLYQSFISTAIATNDKLRMSGIFATDLRPSTSKQELDEPRFAEKG